MVHPSHELLLAESRPALADALVRRAGRGLLSGARVCLMADGDITAAARDELDHPGMLTIGDRVSGERRPAAVLQQWIDLVGAQADPRAPLVVVHQAPVMAASVWGEWLRVEAAVNALVPDGVSEVCGYERDQLTDEQVRGLQESHPLVGNGGTSASPSYVDPGELMARHLWQSPPDGLGAPTAHLDDPTVAGARQALEEAMTGTALTAADVAGLVVGLTETLDNAHRHGRPPVRVTVWGELDRGIVAVSDEGDGPTDPMVGLPRLGGPSPRGVGLRLAHALTDVRHVRTLDGYTVFVQVGRRPA